MTSARPAQPRLYQRLWFRWTAAILLAGALTLLIAAAYVAHNAEPIIRKRIITTVSERFDAPVELDSVSISAAHGLAVTATGLRVDYPRALATLVPHAPGSLLLQARSITFHAGLLSLLRPTTDIRIVHIDGLEIHVPPGEQRGDILGPSKATARRDSQTPLHVGHILCDNSRLFIDTLKPGKAPLEFDIQHLDLSDVDWTRAFQYDATLTIPKPAGTLHAVGTFGPWMREDPRETAIEGDFTLNNANLASIRGISGTLRSAGNFTGKLDALTVNGTTDSPDFAIDTAHTPGPLHTNYNAFVDGTTGDTTLDQVQARLLHSDFTAHGAIVRIPAAGGNGSIGHDIQLDIDMPAVRMEDMLTLTVKTHPPIMRGTLHLKAHLHLPPGPDRVAEKLALTGTFSVQNIAFSNHSVQDKVDSLSLRAQGLPEAAQSVSSMPHTRAVSTMTGDVNLAHAMTTITNLHYDLPGAAIALNGVYSLDGAVFEFKGDVRTEATASQMVSGWKSILLMPVDKFLKKNGAGMQLPVSISGTEGDLHVGLAMGSSHESTRSMAADVRSKTPASQKKH